ncbi:hypothetical protein, partial [Moorena sp. SIO4E2]|uniref:hypothetical protein n=1 Tax=Moorena sp. SIO4E2 TaxID=2607826 RepID=UPI00257C2F8A
MNLFQSQGRYLEFLNSLLGFQVLLVYPTQRHAPFGIFTLCALGRNSNKPSSNLPIRINWVDEFRAVTIVDIVVRARSRPASALPIGAPPR